MTFSDFAKKLKPLLSNANPGGPFAKRLFCEITTYTNDEIDNPIQDAALIETYKAYYTGKRNISGFAPKIINRCEPEKFANYINSFEQSMQDTIYKLFKADCPEMTPSNIPESMGRLFYRIILEAAQIAGKRQSKSKSSEPVSESIRVSDFGLLRECNMRCPLCRESLVKSKNEQTTTSYKIIHIYPENLDIIQQAAFKNIEPPTDPENQSNLLTLCSNCAENYLRCPTPTEYEHLASIKNTLVENLATQASMDTMNVEKGIEQILGKITELHGLPVCAKTKKWKAFCVDKKIPNENFSLQDMVTTYVLHYYHFIDDLFKQMEKARLVSFNKVKHEIGLCFEALDERDLSQYEIFDQMKDWVREKTGCKNDVACGAVISYFVQICEVFHEITE